MNLQHVGLRIAKSILLVLTSLAITAIIMFNEFAAEVTNSLLSGWWRFMLRVFPSITVRWDGIAFMIVALLLTVAVAHSFLKWLFQFYASQFPNSECASWRWRSTLAIVSLILSLFAIGISFSGIVHQTGWVLNSPEPWFAAQHIQSMSDHQLSGYDPKRIDEERNPGWIESILVFLPRYVELVEWKKGWNHPANADRYRKVLPELINPLLGGPVKSPDGYGLSHYAGNQKVFRSDHAIGFADFQNPKDKTLMIAECNAGFAPWPSHQNVRDLTLGIREDWSKSQPGRIGFGPIRNRTNMMALMADGSVRDLDSNTDPSILATMANPLREETP